MKSFWPPVSDCVTLQKQHQYSLLMMCHSKQIWEVWARSVAPQQGFLLNLMPADRYHIRPSVVFSHWRSTSTNWMDLTGESSASVRDDHQHAPTPWRKQSTRGKTQLWTFLMASTCNVQLFFVSFNQPHQLPHQVVSYMSQNDFQHLPEKEHGHLLLICVLYVMQSDWIWILNHFWTFSCRLQLVVVYFFPLLW